MKRDFIRHLVYLVIIALSIAVVYCWRPQTGLVMRSIYLPFNPDQAATLAAEVKLGLNESSNFSAGNRLGELRISVPLHDEQINAAWQQAKQQAKVLAAQHGGKIVVLKGEPQIRSWVGGGNVLWLIGTVY